MRTRKLFTALTTLSIALAITACSGKSNNSTDINTTTDSSISVTTERVKHRDTFEVSEKAITART